MNKKISRRIRRKSKIRGKISGDASRPRLSVYKSNNHISAQLIDDVKRVTLGAASDIKIKKGNRSERAKTIGKEIAEIAKKKKITEVVFDRSGYKYHGRIKELADAAREGGLKF